MQTVNKTASEKSSCVVIGKKRPSSASPTSRIKGNGKKAKEMEERISERFVWSEELHRDFVSAVFDVGLRHSTPSTVFEHMPKHPKVSTQSIKSHLQSYGHHRTKSKKEFMSAYEANVAKSIDGEIDKNQDGQVTVATAAPPDPEDPQESKEMSLPDHDAFMLPHLTETEKMSPLGVAMGYLLGLFFSLKKQIWIQRATPQSVLPTTEPEPDSSNTANEPIAVDYNSFVGTPNDGPAKVRNIDTIMMQREMQSQKAFQNRMRALKQHELDKYQIPLKSGCAAVGNDQAPPRSSSPPQWESSDKTLHHPRPLGPGFGVGGQSSNGNHQESSSKHHHLDASIQRASDAPSEAAKAGTGAPSMDGNDEFWNADAMMDGYLNSWAAND